MIQISPTFLALILPLLLVNVNVINAGTCQPGYHKFNETGERCYQFSTQDNTWWGAVLTCYALQSMLLEINSAAEDRAIAAELRRRNFGSIWTGGTKFYGGAWRWLFSTVFSYRNWYSPNPSNSNGDENCLELRKDGNYRWNDITCYAHNKFVCEKDSTPGCPIFQ